MPGTLRKGKKAIISGLVNQNDLNGDIVTLLRWSKKIVRWEAVCDKNGEKICIRPDNLHSASEQNTKDDEGPDDRHSDRAEKSRARTGKHSLDPVLGNALNQVVRGNSELFDGLGGLHVCGQITRAAFETIVGLGCEHYGIKDENVVMAMIINFIGKEGDPELLFESLKNRLSLATQGFPIPIQC